MRVPSVWSSHVWPLWSGLVVVGMMTRRPALAAHICRSWQLAHARWTEYGAGVRGLACLQHPPEGGRLWTAAHRRRSVHRREVEMQPGSRRAHRCSPCQILTRFGGHGPLGWSVHRCLSAVGNTSTDAEKASRQMASPPPPIMLPL